MAPEHAIAILNSMNVRYALISGLPEALRRWMQHDASRFLPALVFPCLRAPCPFDGDQVFPGVAWLDGELKAGRVRAFAEVVSEYLGISPADPKMEPYWALAEASDVPVGIHMGAGRPGMGIPMAPGDPLLLEQVLLRHKGLRVIVMHAGWPRLESMIALMYSHPNVYVDVAALQLDTDITRPAYMRHLRGLVEAGFGKRILFGSDFPAPSDARAAEYLKAGIDVILGVDFLTTEQKSDILCGNAARFLRLDASVCSP